VTARHFIYGTLTGTASITDLVGGPTNPRVFAKKTMTSSKEECPYVVYKLGNESAEEFSEERDISRQFVQIWVHDFNDGVTADYDKIDAVILEIRKAFQNKNSAVHKVWSTRFLETSQDLNDDTLNTVFRYIRLQVIKED
jgi:prenyltransferase beta subunit